MRNLTLISTGGTIEKTYDEHTGHLENRHSVVHEMLALLRLEDTSVNVIQLMSKDSQHFTDADRRRVLDAVRLVVGSGQPGDTHGVVLLHGTDTLCLTGDYLHEQLRNPPVPVVITGALRPFEMKRSDALQNLTEAIFSAGILDPGVWLVAHGRALRFPGLAKDLARGTFVRVQS